MRRIKFIFIFWLLITPLLGQTDDSSKTFDWHQSFDGSEKYIAKEILNVYLGEGKEIDSADISKYKNRLENFKFCVDQNGDFYVGYEKRLNSPNQLYKRGPYVISKFYKTGQKLFENENLSNEFGDKPWNFTAMSVDESNIVTLSNPSFGGIVKLSIDGKITRTNNLKSDYFKKSYKGILTKIDIDMVHNQPNGIGPADFVITNVSTGKPIVTLTDSAYGNGYIDISPFGEDC